MKKIFVIVLIMFSFFNKALGNYAELAHEFQFKGINGQTINLGDYKS